MTPRLGSMALAMALLATGAYAHGYKKKSLEIVHPWIMETAGPDGTVSMIIRNTGKEADKLIGVTAEGAETATLKKVADTGHVDTKAIEIPAGGEAVLHAEGAHVHLAGLKKKLGAYDHVPLELTFERMGKMKIEVMVEQKE